MRDNLLKEKTIAWLNTCNRHRLEPLYYLVLTSKWTLYEQLIYIAHQHAPNLSKSAIFDKIILARRDDVMSLIIFQGILHNLTFSQSETRHMIRVALHRDRIDILQLLLKKDPRHITHFYPSEQSNLFIAIHFNRPGAIELLIRMGANPYLKNAFGRNAFDLCQFLGRVDLYHYMSQIFQAIVPQKTIGPNEPPSSIYHINIEEDTDTLEEGVDMDEEISPFTQILYNTLLKSA